MITCILSNSKWQKTAKKRPNGNPTFIMVHSTGCNNKSLKRYVQPSANDPNFSSLKSKIGDNIYNNSWNENQLDKGVNAFIGCLANGDVEIALTGGEDIITWHCGMSYLNQNALAVEVCEDALKDKTYFNKVIDKLIELLVYWCKKYDIDPMEKSKGVYRVLSHAEGHKSGLASNHGDIDYWLKKFNITMDDIRARVENQLKDTVIYKLGERQTIELGDMVKIKQGAKWFSDKAIPSWVMSKSWIVSSINPSTGRVVLDKDNLCSPIHINDIYKA